VIKIGRSEPIRKGTSVSANGLRSENIEYRDVGVILNVKVDVEENNVVKLYLSQEISDIIQTVGNPLIDSPSFTKNSLEMTTMINDGQKIYVGGLMENSINKKVRKIPILGDIPYLGKMFRSEDINKTKTELILLLSVEILFNEKDFENQRLRFVRKT
jgi:general secretion pathway protein D